MPYVYSPTYLEDQKREHDFYINLGNQCRIAEAHRLKYLKNVIKIEEEIAIQMVVVLVCLQMVD
jgi:hypothetical protein